MSHEPKYVATLSETADGNPVILEMEIKAGADGGAKLMAINWAASAAGTLGKESWLRITRDAVRIFQNRVELAHGQDVVEGNDSPT